MEWVAAISHGLLLVVVCMAQVGGVLMLLAGLPGTWVILGSVVVYGLLTGWQSLSLLLLVVLLLLAVAGEIIEFLASGVGAQRFGASRGGMIAAVIGVFPGMIVGSLIFPIVGTILGGFAGAFAATFLWELGQRRTREEAWRAGVGAMLGRTGAVFAKVVIAVVMSGAFLWTLIWGGAV